MTDIEEMKVLLSEMEATSASYLEACNTTGEARRNETAWLNQLNEKQKRFNELLAALKTQSPRDSDWKRDATGSRP